jgi:hypothetical protein
VIGGSVLATACKALCKSYAKRFAEGCKALCASNWEDTDVTAAPLAGTNRDTEQTDAANAEALRQLFDVDPFLVDIAPALEALPGMAPNVILTSGPPLPWSEYLGGQRRAIAGATVHEGLAASIQEAETLLEAGEVVVAGCHDYACVGSLAGVTSASMPVLVVQDAHSGQRGHCTLFEGATPARLNYGVWNDAVAANLRYLAHTIAPKLAGLIRSIDGGIALKPIMRRALAQGDEMHSRNTAASLMFLREIVPALVELDSIHTAELVTYLTTGDYFFLRPAMAASKVMADQMSGVAGSSIVTAMAFSCREFGIRVSGTGSRWFRGPLPVAEQAKFFDGHGPADLEVMGGESPITEVCGLGAMGQAAAFTLQDYQGGVQTMIERNLEMYTITAAEHPELRIPFFAFRGTPVGIDVHRVAETGTSPVMDVGIAGRAGGQIGAGLFRAPIEPFIAAHKALLSA